MATPQQIVEELMQEFGKTAPEVRQRLTTLVGEITVDLLSQNDSRFSGLSKTETITLSAEDTVFTLPVDFASYQPDDSFIVNTDGAYLADFTVVTDKEFAQRRRDGHIPGYTYGHIELRVATTGKRWYLVLGEAYSTDAYLRFNYYRKPTANDTDIINNTRILKTGVRGEVPDLNPDFVKDAGTYENMKRGFKETPTSRVSGMKLRPSRHIQRHNRLMHKAGRGR